MILYVTASVLSFALSLAAHRATRRDLEWLRKQYDRIREDLETKDPRKAEETEPVDAKKDQTSLHLAEEIQKRDLLVSELQRKIIEMERDREEKKETDRTSLMKQLELENEELRKVNDQLKNQVHSRAQSINSDSSVDSSRVEPIGSELENPPIAIIEATQLSPVTIDEEKEESRVTRRRTYKISNSESPEVKQLRKLLNEMQQKEIEYLEKIKTLENNKKNAHTGESLVLKKQISTLERRLKEAEKLVDVNKKNSMSSMEELSDLKYECEVLRKENKRLITEVENLRTREREHANCARTISALEKEFRLTLEMNKIMYEDLNRERLLRKKYYNMVEEMKGKIRVCCRIRPMTTRERQHSPAAVAEIIDSYSLRIDTKSGAKEFQFDKVYGPDDTQEKVFADASALIQSAYDGYNVCICAYGQTGSGKTFTIVGDESNPGLAPRTFEKIFQLAEEYSQQFTTDVSMYMVELHNDRLIDLLKPDGNNEEKLEIKKDKKGVVWIQGCSQVSVPNAPTLLAYFARGTENRHTAFTRMNEKSSRSHLVVGIAIECTSHLHGTKTKGKVSLLDLAGSERVSKSGVSSDSLKETTFINKSLSALGDVISALTTAQEFIPYRNSKLTMLMQDSLGGNAKTLMFVNASPAAYNLEETLNSLTYASRVKQITNSASKLAESKEITKLKTIISKMRRGESVDYLESIS